MPFGEPVSVGVFAVPRARPECRQAQGNNDLEQKFTALQSRRSTLVISAAAPPRPLQRLVEQHLSPTA